MAQPTAINILATDRPELAVPTMMTICFPVGALGFEIPLVMMPQGS